MSFSLRTKILLSLLSIPTLGLLFLSLVTINSFYDDRLAYIFDASLTQTRLQAEVANSLIGNVCEKVQQRVHDLKVLNANSLNDLNNQLSILKREKHILSLEMFLVNKPSKRFRKLYSLREKFPLGPFSNSSQTDPTAEEIFLAFDPLKGEINELFLSSPLRESIAIWFEAPLYKASQETSLLIKMQIQIAELRKMIPGQLITDSLLINQDGAVLFVNTAVSRAVTSQIGKDIATNNSKSGSYLVDANPKEKYIVSFSRVGPYNLYASNLIRKKLALEPVKLIEGKVITLFLIIILLIVTMGVLLSRHLTQSIRQLLLAADAFSRGEFAVNIQIHSRDEIYALGEKFLEMVQKVKKLISDTRDLGRMESELKMAQTVQQTLFPKADAEFDSISVNSYCEPCSECGGDFWFYEKIGENLYLGLGDATGHGASAALITSAARAAISVILRNGVSEPKDILTLLNTAIYDTAKGKITMTFFLMRIHLPTSEMVYVNAAHEPPLFVKNPSPTMRKKDLDVLSEGATHALGRDESAEFEQHSLLLEAGDLITVFSDGIYDVVNPEGVAWGEGNFTRAFIDGLKSSRMTKVCLNKMTDTMNKFRQNSGLVDDVTLVMIKKNR